MKCQHCGGRQFYVARTYKGTELFDVKEIEANEDPYVVMSGERTDDEYLAIEDESLMCNDCCEEVLDDDAFSEFTKTWE